MTSTPNTSDAEALIQALKAPALSDDEAIAAFAAQNPEPQCLLQVIADNSRSMLDEDRLSALVRALPILKQTILEDRLAAKRIQLGLMTLAPLTQTSPFQLVGDWTPPAHIAPGSGTPLGAAFVQSVNSIRTRTQALRANGVHLYRPWLLIISDGAPTDDISEARQLARAITQREEINIFAVGVGDVDLERLAPLSPKNAPKRLRDADFADLFLWVTQNIKAVSRSASHSGAASADRVALTKAGWADA